MAVRKAAPPTRRETAGSIVALTSAALLLVLFWQIGRLGEEAGGDLPTLRHERAAVTYARALTRLLVDVERYRNHVAMLRDPISGIDLRARIDADLARQSRLTRIAAPTRVRAEFAALERGWRAARGQHRRTDPRPVTQLIARLLRLFGTLEDASGLTYDPNQDAQNLADADLAKIPYAYNEAYHADLLGENALTRRGIGIADRVYLGTLLYAASSDFNLASDEISQILQARARREPRSSPADLQLQRAAAAYTAAGTALASALRTGVLQRAVPEGDPHALRLRTQRASAAIGRLDDGLLALLDSNLAQRSRSQQLRDRYVFTAVLLIAVLLAACAMFLAEYTARRNRQALLEAQQESARLWAQIAREKAERALRLSEAQFRAVFDGAAMGIAILDKNAAIRDANTVFRRIYGDSASRLLEGREREFAELMRGQRDLFEYEGHLSEPDGEEAWTDVTISLVCDDAGEPLFAICIFRDLTELKRSERRMEHGITHDALTSLPNRVLFETQLRARFAAAQNAPDAFFAVIVLDLDRFKEINESLGHEAGDAVLAQAAQRLQSCAQAGDLVARLGSDEFAVLVDSLTDVLHVELVARRMLSALSNPLQVAERSIFVSAGAGIAVASGSYERAEDVMRDADIAMRYAKGGGISRVAVFDSKMHVRAQQRLQLNTDMRLALERGEFHLLYQPIVDLASGELVGCEALVRWNHPVNGLMLPLEFLPLAEQSGLAGAIGRQVLSAACRQLAQWKADLGERAFLMNVNVSAAEIVEPEFERTLLEIAGEFGIRPGELTLEITESAVLDTGTRPELVVERVRAYGFNICIDDFGTGYSSLRYLQQFKVDGIKIDRSFIAGSDGEIASEPIIRTLMTLAEAFDVRVVAEGVETVRQRDALRNAGCRYAQGYYFARPLPAEELRRAYPSVLGRVSRPASA